MICMPLRGKCVCVNNLPMTVTRVVTIELRVQRTLHAKHWITEPPG